jgi:hypothetical protein
MKIPGFCKTLSSAALLALLLPQPAGAQSRPTEPPRRTEKIGSWVLSCPQDPAADKMPCRLRHRVWVLAPQAGHPDAAMEVENRQDGPVPVLVVHDLNLPDAVGALLAQKSMAEVQFDFEDTLNFPCAFAHGGLTCGPKPADEKVASVRLQAAQVALVRLHLALPAGTAPAMPDQLRALDMDRTRDALRRIETGAAETSGWDWRDLLEWLLRQIGFQGGLAQLRHWLMDQVASLMNG